MQITVNGFLTDYQSRILLQKVSNGTLLPVGCEAEPGVLPTDSLARAFRKETGLIVMPVRMTGMYFSGNDGGELTFCFRCTMRGGDLAVPEGQPPAGFFDYSPMPRGLSARHRQQADQALHHPGGMPVMERDAAGVGKWLEWLAGRPDPTPTDIMEWSVSIRLEEVVGGDEVVWVLDDIAGTPADPVASGEAPWEAARRLLSEAHPDTRNPVTKLIRIEVSPVRPVMTFVFGAIGSGR